MKRLSVYLLVLAFGFAFGRAAQRDRARPTPVVSPVGATSLSVVDHSAEYPTAKRYTVADTRDNRPGAPGVTPPRGALVLELRTDSGLLRSLICTPDE